MYAQGVLRKINRTKGFLSSKRPTPWGFLGSGALGLSDTIHVKNKSDKFLTGLMRDPWVLRFKVGSLWPAVKWQAFGGGGASEGSRCITDSGMLRTA
jgi:hypothetical protein